MYLYLYQDLNFYYEKSYLNNLELAITKLCYGISNFLFSIYCHQAIDHIEFKMNKPLSPYPK